MAPKQSLIPREGLVVDALINFVRKYLLNPKYTLPLFLFMRYHRKGQDFAGNHQRLFKFIRRFLVWGLLYRFNDYLNWGARNNWIVDGEWGKDWSKEIAVVTGGSGGIGGFVVRGLAERGVKVVVLDVIDLTYEAPENVYFYKCDISSTSKLAEVAEEIRTTVDHPTIIINNAGVARGNTILDATEKDVRFTFDVNILAHFWVIKEFLPDMAKKNHGHVVTVASVAGYIGAPQMVDYAASKAAAISFHEGLSMELKHRYNANKVRTTLVTQGLTRTPLFTGFGDNSPFLFPQQHPESVAEGIVDAVFRGEAEHLIFPKTYGLVTGLRGRSHWFQEYFRNGTRNLMNNFCGRQVIDPNNESEEVEVEEVVEDVSKSGVLV